jgi:hypothetical protein
VSRIRETAIATSIRKTLDDLDPRSPDECGAPTSFVYLKWMCDQIISNSQTWSEDKLNRWIGYIQGAMVARGWATLDDERARIRECIKTDKASCNYLADRPLPQPGELWRHWKGGLYCIVGIGRHTETEEQFVVYWSFGHRNLNCRPLEMFMDILGDEKEGTCYYRFERVQKV